MDMIVRPLTIYAFMLVIVRLSGRRTLASMTAFDFVLLLLIGQATQHALLGPNYSITNALVVIAALIGTDMAMSELKQRSPRVEKVIEGVPIVLIEDGRPQEESMATARVDTDDILEAARRTQGLSQLDQIRYAILERTGGISIIPYPTSA